MSKDHTIPKPSLKDDPQLRRRFNFEKLDPEAFKALCEKYGLIMDTTVDKELVESELARRMIAKGVDGYPIASSQEYERQSKSLVYPSVTAQTDSGAYVTAPSSKPITITRTVRVRDTATQGNIQDPERAGQKLRRLLSSLIQTTTYLFSSAENPEPSTTKEHSPKTIQHRSRAGSEIAENQPANGSPGDADDLTWYIVPFIVGILILLLAMLFR